MNFSAILGSVGWRPVSLGIFLPWWEPCYSSLSFSSFLSQSAVRILSTIKVSSDSGNITLSYLHTDSVATVHWWCSHYLAIAMVHRWYIITQVFFDQLMMLYIIKLGQLCSSLKIGHLNFEVISPMRYILS